MGIAFRPGMNSGIYSPTFRMAVGHMNNMDTISENLANCTAPGYKKIQISHKLFDLIYRQAQSGQMHWTEGERYDPIEVDFSPGALRGTERPLDFAIRGEGFFVVMQDGKDYYSRDGAFRLDSERRLVNTAGLPVKGQNGEIVLPANVVLSKLTVDADGSLREGRRVHDKLQMVNFPDWQKLSRVGPSLFEPSDGMQPEDPSENTQMVNGYLEQSNTTIFDEMAEMISCVRAFESCQRMIRAQDEAQGKLIQQTG